MDRCTYFIGWRSTSPVAEVLMREFQKREPGKNYVFNPVQLQRSRSRLFRKLRDGDGSEHFSRNREDVWSLEYLPQPSLLRLSTLADVERLSTEDVFASIDFLGTPWMNMLWEEQKQCDIAPFGAFCLNNLYIKFGPHLIYGPPPGNNNYIDDDRLVARYCTGSVSITGDHGPNDVQKTVEQLIKLPSIVKLREALKPVVGEVYEYISWC